MPSTMSPIDRFINAADNALRTVSGGVAASRPCPRPLADDTAADVLDDPQKRLSGALMRVNHVGEVCAQALYHAQALATRDPALRAHFERAARDETDHLAWIQTRLRDLGDRPSLLNPLWYAGAFGIGWIAGKTSDALSLGFVVETERQVERHLEGHLERLPAADLASRAIVEQMKEDEALHASQAQEAGAMALPAPARWLMRAAAKVMTGTAHYV
ncbi:MAG: 2-polyprenyl-3-methyl-6-methoxy-1,4-benzoquinone monooxygenase [Piscinibacter sp.]|jgi:ubiquinone biosynthesis monooxygenase Coq7|nr:2-polyprenyl-3-methyl-6-methoxy-1,4-benzoquinone monooxygenase [Piscinibacter sp.]